MEAQVILMMKEIILLDQNQIIHQLKRDHFKEDNKDHIKMVMMNIIYFCREKGKLWKILSPIEKIIVTSQPKRGKLEKQEKAKMLEMLNK